jgi:hypothetical protein
MNSEVGRKRMILALEDARCAVAQVNGAKKKAYVSGRRFGMRLNAAILYGFSPWGLHISTKRLKPAPLPALCGMPEGRALIRVSLQTEHYRKVGEMAN